MRLLTLVSYLCAASCSPQPKPGTEPVMPPLAATPPADAGPATPRLPPGVLARVEGKQGTILVEERDGLRLLIIDDVVHAAVRVGASNGPDPIVSLVKTMRPNAKNALVIGLGSGKTCTDLSAAGLAVDAVELEPAVIELARKFFGFKGRAVAGDGLEYLKKSTMNYDVIVMDAFAGIDPPRHLVTPEAFAEMGARTVSGGLVITRGLGEPRDPSIKQIYRAMRAIRSDHMVWTLVLGSGVGMEIQNLYLVSSDKPINFVNVSGAALWPLRLEGWAPTWMEPTLRDEKHKGKASRKVRLVGYVIRLTENGALALDLPHWEMGAVRYILSGDAAKKLEALLPPKSKFPTSGDIRSDGDPSKTLHEVLGGGGFKRSDVRFSAVAAGLVGTATLRSVVHPDAAAFVPKHVRGDAVTDPLLPYGGALYDLTVESVEWTLDRRGWERLHKSLGPTLRRVVKDIRARNLVSALTGIRSYRDGLSKKIPDYLPPVSDMKKLEHRLQQEMKGAAAKPTAYQMAVVCDRASHGLIRDDAVAKDVERVRVTLVECARINYERAAIRPAAPKARDAANRLLWLYEEQLLLISNRAKERALQAIVRKLVKRHPDAEANRDPPPRAW